MRHFAICHIHIENANLIAFYYQPYQKYVTQWFLQNYLQKENVTIDGFM